MKNQKDALDKEVLLVEYQVSQESYQHHDNLVWTVTTIIWGGTLVLFGFILGGLDKPNFQLILTILSMLGIALTIAVWVFALQFNSIMRQKYQRCKDIEKLLGMYQNQGLKYVKGLQRIVYAIVTVLFIIVWLFVIWMLWSN